MAHIDEQAAAWRRRLNERRLQKAKFGDTSDPSIPMEIEDLQKKLDSVETIKQQLELLTAYRAHTHQLLKQRAILGGTVVPPHVTMQITTNRRSIADIKRGLLKEYQYAVDPDPSDEDPAVEVDTIQQVRERLHTLETLVRLGQKEASLELINELRRIVS